MVKIKFDIGGGEIVNTLATIIRKIDGYMVIFPNGSYNNNVSIIGRIFKGN